jgi:hypothetical protein
MITVSHPGAYVYVYVELMAKTTGVGDVSPNRARSLALRGHRPWCRSRQSIHPPIPDDNDRVNLRHPMWLPSAAPLAASSPQPDSG